ncbi:two-component sensor histidine kinase/PAS domain-containing protein [Sphingomonas insulae]|nr:HWE histidine kinase domain-containing protein [Sphingomonas insulae]NIJ30516.1 two-component sensor histidine kinase/PAS domain-containing protein [Sphingomonas insulae]
MLRAHDWSTTALGDRAGWPQSLRTAVDMMMASGHAMCLAWGTEGLFLYNDAYAPMLGSRHPQAFGARFADVWADVWADIAPLVDATFCGETSTFQDMPLVMTRNGYPERTWWTFSYSPVRDERGEVAGLLNVTLETTGRVQAERERDAAVDGLSRAEAGWRRIFETLAEGFILGALVRSADGAVIDWRYEEVNNAWYDLVGIERGCALGRTIRSVFPGIEDAWVDGAARVVATGESLRFTRQVGTLGRWYDGVIQPAGDDRFTIIFTEVTDRVLRERRQAAIIALTDRLQQETDARSMTMAASTILGRALDVQLVGYGDVDAATETITVESNWTSEGAATLAGTLHFRDFGSYVDDLQAGRTVVVRDCRADPRTRDHAAALEARSARAFVNTPVVERGTFVALLYVSSDRPRSWTEDELQFIGDVAYRLRSAVEQLRAVEQQEILNGELAHRVKNTLSVVQAIAAQTLAGKADDAAVAEFGSRLKALASAHDVLLTRSWSAATLHDVARSALATFAGDRMRMSGPDLWISSRAAMSLSLLLHELATNAAKYGALSHPDGVVTMTWAVRPGPGGDVLHVTWRERGGPPAAEPVRRGFGARIIRMGLIGSGGVEQHYDRHGLTIEMSAPLDQVQQA